jgi:hypothetical protein
MGVKKASMNKIDQLKKDLDARGKVFYDQACKQSMSDQHVAWENLGSLQRHWITSVAICDPSPSREALDAGAAAILDAAIKRSAMSIFKCNGCAMDVVAGSQVDACCKTCMWK